MGFWQCARRNTVLALPPAAASSLPPCAAVQQLCTRPVADGPLPTPTPFPGPQFFFNYIKEKDLKDETNKQVGRARPATSLLQRCGWNCRVRRRRRVRSSQQHNCFVFERAC